MKYLKENYPDDLNIISEEIILALMYVNDFEKIDDWIRYFEENNIHFEYHRAAYYYNVLFPDAQTNYFEERLENDLPIFYDFKEDWLDYIRWTIISQNNYYSKAFVTYILKDFIQAEKQAIELVNFDWESEYNTESGKRFWSRMDIWANGLLGAIYARLSFFCVYNYLYLYRNKNYSITIFSV